MAQQHRPGRYQDTAGDKRKKWTQDHENVMECYLRSEQRRRGYRKRMVEIPLWRSKDMFEVTEQRLMDQFRHTKKKEMVDRAGD